MFKKVLLFQLISFAIACFQEECLDAHNKYRAQHSADALILDPNLQKLAQNHANYLAENFVFEHAKNHYGENMFYASIPGEKIQMNGSFPVSTWYQEIEKYDWDKPRFTPFTGHFSQVVWKGSKRLGCALNITGNNIYVVANYDPAGNINAWYADNVTKQ